MKAEELKPQELRFGNYIKSKESGFNHIVLGIEDKRVSLDKSKYPYDFLRDCEPVPLTEEWLLRFGFKKDDFWDGNYHNFWDYNGYLGLLYVKPYILLTHHIPNQIKESINIKEIRYVHELQNLWYILSGQELTLNEEMQK